MTLTPRLERFPRWAELRPYLRIESYDRDGGHRHPRHRIEFRGVPMNLALEALAYQIPCVACGELVQPFRERLTRNPRPRAGAWIHHGFYYAPSCTLRHRIACSRGAAASREYEAVIARYSAAVVRRGKA